MRLTQKNKMRYWIQKIILLLFLAALETKEPELPLCPTNVQYFPQNLPMHCRMPATVPPLSGKMLQSLSGFPGPFPGPMPGTIPGSIPGMIPGPMPMPMPMVPMPQPPAQKLPVVVMPFYSPETKKSQDYQSHRPRHKKHRIFGFKRRPKHYYRSDEDSTDDTSSDDSSDRSSDRGWWKMSREGRRSNRHRTQRRKHQNKELLTPVLQYVTKDGYVIYEKQISKSEAKNWLGNKKDNDKRVAQSKYEENPDSKEPNNDGDTKFLIKDDENVEIKTESSPRLIHQKKSFKRKTPKKHNLK